MIVSDTADDPIGVAATATRPALAANQPARTILVAVHGIGDQIGYATVQSVAARVGAYYGIAAAVPLGRFYPAASSDAEIRPGPQLMMPPQDPHQLQDIGLAEVYWAGIARDVQKRGYILEETKRWVRTVSARLALRSSQHDTPMPKGEHDRLVAVLDEMVETVLVLERLTAIGRQTGLFTFNLKALLTDFLGDVQIVSEFIAYRGRILAEFDRVMREALQLAPPRPPQDTHLHIIAHSEGSVVAFIALLTALAAPERHEWVRSVRGFMTIGSPIETHHILWPRLWGDLVSPLKQAAPATTGRAQPIVWRNYYDKGDPIAYALNETTAWLRREQWMPFFEFQEIAFSRSCLPGKAHVDYWQDDAVFHHYLEEVVKLRRPDDMAPAAAPANRPHAIVLSYATPNLLLALVFMAATYLLYRPVWAAVSSTPPTPGRTLLDVTGIGLLLLGVTAAARIPRLTDRWRWWAISQGLMACSMGAYATLVNQQTRRHLAAALTVTPLSRLIPTFPTIVVPAVGLQSLGAIGHWRWERIGLEVMNQSTGSLLLVAALISLVCASLASWFPRQGTRVLPAAGFLIALGLVLRLMLPEGAGPQRDVEVWPIALGGAAFFYLWWLGGLLFDLVFVWHRYVRHSAGIQGITHITTHGYKLPPMLRIARYLRRRPSSVHSGAPT